jgi:hypothetical protein
MMAKKLFVKLIQLAAVTILIFNLKYSIEPVSAHPADVYGPSCGAATIDGEVHAVEWSEAATQTFQMIRPGGADQFTASLYAMNSGNYLYLGITISDDEFSTHGLYLPLGDGFRIDFDNDHDGSLYALNDDVLVISAGSPQFHDNYVYVPVNGSATSDIEGGGTSDGSGAASRVNGLNHFELRHPLCSGDSLDFCLHANDTVGFRMEYLDAQANGDFGGTQFYPGSSINSEADIVIGDCSVADMIIYLPLAARQ